MFYIGSVVHIQPHFLQTVLWEILPCGNLSNKPELFTGHSRFKGPIKYLAHQPEEMLLLSLNDV